MNPFKNKKEELEFNMNEDIMKQLISKMNRKFAKVELGGGQKKIDKQHQKGKMIARERIDFLRDPKSNFIEIG